MNNSGHRHSYLPSSQDPSKEAKPKSGFWATLARIFNPFRGKSNQDSSAGSKLFIGNLSYQAKESDLRALFSKYGEIKSIDIVSHRRSGQSKGYAFVHMANKEDGLKALALNSTTVLGRQITVVEARSGGAGGRQRWNNKRRNGNGRKRFSAQRPKIQRTHDEDEPTHQTL